MTPVYQVLKGITLFGLLGILASCSGSNNLARNNRTGYNGVGGNQAGGVSISPSGQFYAPNGQPCNVNAPSTSPQSPAYPGSACASIVPNGQQQVAQQQTYPQPMYQQQQAPIPQQQQVPVQQQQQQPQYAGVGQQQVPGSQQGPAVNPSLPNQPGYNPQQSSDPQTYDLSSSIDIDERTQKIKGNRSRAFYLNGGAGVQHTWDNCFTGTGKDFQGKNLPLHEMEIGRFFHTADDTNQSLANQQPVSDKIQFTFDSNGNVMINIHNPELKGVSSQRTFAVPYDLDYDSRTIHFGDENRDDQIVLEGPVSADYVEHEQNDAETNNRWHAIDLKTELGFSDDFASDFPLHDGISSSSGTSGDHYEKVCTPTQTATTTATLVTSANGKPTNGQRAAGITSTEPLGKTAGDELSAGNQVATGTSDGGDQNCHLVKVKGIASSGHAPNSEKIIFPAGITVKFYVHPQNPLHITSMYINKAAYTSYAYVRSHVGEDCTPKSKGMFYQTWLK